MKAKTQPKPSALRHKVEVSFAETEAMGRISFQGPPIGPWKQVQNTPVDVIRDELKPQSEMLAPSSVMTSPSQTQASVVIFP